MPRISTRTYTSLTDSSSGYAADEEEGTVKYYNCVAQDGSSPEYIDVADISIWKGPKQFFFLGIFAFLATLFIVVIYNGGINASIIGRLVIGRSGKHNVLDDDGANELAYFPYSMRRQGYSTLMCFDPTSGNIFKYKFLEKFNGLLEPYVTNQLAVYDPLFEEGSHYLKYSICPSSDSGTNILSSSSSSCFEGTYRTEDDNDGVFIECNPFDEFEITMERYNISNNTIVDSNTGKFVCIYVRRELRALTKEDLDKTMDAMATLWWTPEEEGQASYGDNYHAATFLLEFHFFNAAWRDADHIHEGNGFLAQHIKMTNIYEDSIQSVDPSISLPYWDYTIESTTGISVYDSPMFTNETFGTLNPPTSEDGWTYGYNSILDAAIPDGRWKHIATDPNIKYDDLYSAYGYMRAPWNLNPSPYISRFVATLGMGLPSCKAHMTLLQYQDVKDLLKEAPYAPHATTHGTIGGNFGCDLLDTLVDEGVLLEDEKAHVCSYWIVLLKESYRGAYITPRTDCSVSGGDSSTLKADDQDCGFICSEERMPAFRDHIYQQLAIKEFASEEMLSNFSANATVDAWVEFICEGDAFKIFGGDHFESASPADPSFWPIHPTIERVIHLKYLTGGFTDNDRWPEVKFNIDGREYICNKQSHCYDEDSAEFGAWDACCYGHYPDDQLLDAPNNNRFAGYGMTNRELFEGFDASSEGYSMTYIYDHFEWPHCADTLSDISGFSKALYSAVQEYNDMSDEDKINNRPEILNVPTDVGVGKDGSK